MEVYLDNAATTKVLDSVAEAMLNVMENNYANPSSMHKMGWEAEQCVTKARDAIAGSLKCDKKEILFTSGGTEANNLALIGCAYAYRRNGKHIITTGIEHPSVNEPLRYLQQNGFEITYLSVDVNGLVNDRELLGAIREDTILLSVISVNNEIGAVQDLNKLSQLAKGKKKDLVFHTDAVQAYGKYSLFPKRSGIDLLSASAHKIHGPKGVGFLYKQEKIRLNPILFGGGQERDYRSGTENVPGIVGMGKAVLETYKDLDHKREQMYRRKERFLEGIRGVPGAKVNGMDGIPFMNTAPHIISVSFDGVKSEVLLHSLEEKEIYVSSGSACSSNHPKTSGTLEAVGVAKERLDTTLRFSFSQFTSEESIDYTIEALKELVPVLSKYRKR